MAPSQRTPAIDLTVGTDAPQETDVIIQTPRDAVSFHRGFGESGYRVEIVEHECPQCRFDRMIRQHDVHPEQPDRFRYWCLNPNCPYYLSDDLGHACHGRNMPTTEPKVTQI